MIVACVFTGNRYSAQYVYLLKNAVASHLSVPHHFTVLTDQPDVFPDLYCVDIKALALPGWWGKMALFKPDWRLDERVVYLDLDTVVCGSIDPLAALDVEFGICENFTRTEVNPNWPCKYGSCVMTIGPNKMASVWATFAARKTELMRKADIYGDQYVIEALAPAATILQEVLPPGFFLHYKRLTDAQPAEAALVIFGGRNKPHDTAIPWVRKAWRA